MFSRIGHSRRLYRLCGALKTAASSSSTTLQRARFLPRLVHYSSVQTTRIFRPACLSVISARPLSTSRDFSSKSRRHGNKRGSKSNDKESVSRYYTAKIKNAPSWQKSLMVLDEMERAGVEIDVFQFTAAIAVCGKCKKVEVAMKLYRKMIRHGIEPNVVTYNALISACEKIYQWEQALELLREMSDRGIEPDVISYSAAISACEKGGQWEKALDILQEMANCGIEPEVISYNAAIEACFGSEKYSEALSLVRRALETGHYPIFWKQKSPKWDLHGFPFAVACMLIVESLIKTTQDSLANALIGDIIIVTGKGLGSGNEGPVLRTKVPEFFREVQGPILEPVEGNEGRFLIKQMALQMWLESGDVEQFKLRITARH